MATKDLYNQRQKKKASQMETQPKANFDEKNAFVASMRQEQQKEIKRNSTFKIRATKTTESYYLDEDVVNAIRRIADEDKSLNKSIVAEGILREYLVKNGYLDKK